MRTSIAPRAGRAAPASRRCSVACAASAKPTRADGVRSALAKLCSAGAAAALLVASPALADLNEFEYNAGAEFGNG